MIYLDSCIVIYLLEKHPAYYTPLDNLFRHNLNEGFAISPLVMLECLVYPLKQNDQDLQQRFEEFFQTVTVFTLDEVVFREAALLRANSAMKTPDALHLAAVKVYGCKEFWTNDDRLQHVSLPIKNVLNT